MNRLGVMLKFNRTEIYGWSLQEAAKKIGTSKSQLHELESGANKNPRLSTIARLCAVYHIAPEHIIKCAELANKEQERT